MNACARYAPATAVMIATAGVRVGGCSDDDSGRDTVSPSASPLSVSVWPTLPDDDEFDDQQWRTTIATPGGPIEVSGEIFDKYVQSGGASGPLGLPQGPEHDAPHDGDYQEFSGGAIYWSAATGAHIVAGAIRTAWYEHGGAVGRFGYPTSDEVSVEGGKRSEFTGGTITWSGGRITLAEK